MPLDYATLDSLRTRHPAWRLLRSDHAPLIAAFLERVFVLPNRRVIPAAELTEALEDELYALRQRVGDTQRKRQSRGHPAEAPESGTPESGTPSRSRVSRVGEAESGTPSGCRRTLTEESVHA